MRVTDSTKRSSSSPILIGVSGGSGSGKTYFANRILAQLGDEECNLIFQDNFYFDQSARFDFEGGCVNFDHPDSIDFELMVDCLSRLKQGQPTQIPIYDFCKHQRTPQTLAIQPKRVIVVDGILIFHPEKLRQLFDHRIFFDTPESLRYQRRLERDVKERARTEKGVYQQFHSQVKPMHDQYVEPTKAFAHHVFSENSTCEDKVISLIRRASH